MILEWDRKEDLEGLEESERFARKVAQVEFERVLETTEIMWRQKSNVQSLKRRGPQYEALSQNNIFLEVD